MFLLSALGSFAADIVVILLHSEFADLLNDKGAYINRVYKNLSAMLNILVIFSISLACMHGCFVSSFEISPMLMAFILFSKAYGPLKIHPTCHHYPSLDSFCSYHSTTMYTLGQDSGSQWCTRYCT